MELGTDVTYQAGNVGDRLKSTKPKLASDHTFRNGERLRKINETLNQFPGGDLFLQM
jgi:hypothetical protein